MVVGPHEVANFSLKNMTVSGELCCVALPFCCVIVALIVHVLTCIYIYIYIYIYICTCM